jgi:hypothetical protein
VKHVRFLFVVLFISFGSAAEKQIVIPEANGNNDIYSTIAVGNFVLTLVRIQDRCTLRYKGEDDVEKSLDVGIGAPCEFIWTSREDKKLQTYTYLTGVDKRTAVLITGGPPDPYVKDALQPNGCGTALAKLRVFDNRIELAWSGFNGTPICPTRPVEEVMFNS